VWWLLIVISERLWSMDHTVTYAASRK